MTSCETRSHAPRLMRAWIAERSKWIRQVSLMLLSLMTSTTITTMMMVVTLTLVADISTAGDARGQGHQHSWMTSHLSVGEALRGVGRLRCRRKWTPESFFSLWSQRPTESVNVPHFLQATRAREEWNRIDAASVEKDSGPERWER